MAQPNNEGFLYMGTASGSSLPAYGSESWQLVTEASNLKLPDYSLQRASYKVLAETTRRSLGGSLAEQTVTGSLVADKADAVVRQILDDIRTGTMVRRNWRFTEPDDANSEVYWVGFVQTLERVEYDGEGDGAPHLWNITIAVDGAVTK